jgi:hypothetical protein
MSRRITCLAALGVFAAAYVAYPLATLYQLNDAVAADNPAALGRLVDWPAVRQGVKADMDSGDELAPIGASFMRSVAIDSMVTPKGILAALHAAHGQEPTGIRLRGIRLESPTRLLVAIGTGLPHEALRLRMDLRGDGVWQVTRAWLPNRMVGPPAPVQAASAVQ